MRPFEHEHRVDVRERVFADEEASRKGHERHRAGTRERGRDDDEPPHCWQPTPRSDHDDRNGEESEEGRSQAASLRSRPGS